MVAPCAHSNRKSFLSNLNEHSVLNRFHRQPFKLRHRIHDFVTAGLPTAEMCDYTSIGDFDAEALISQLLYDNCFQRRHSDFAIGLRRFEMTWRARDYPSKSIASSKSSGMKCE